MIFLPAFGFIIAIMGRLSPVFNLTVVKFSLKCQRLTIYWSYATVLFFKRILVRIYQVF